MLDNSDVKRHSGVEGEKKIDELKILEVSHEKINLQDGTTH